MKKKTKSNIITRSLRLSFSIAKSQFILMLIAGIVNCMLVVLALYCTNEIFNLVEKCYVAGSIDNAFYIQTGLYFVILLCSSAYVFYYKRYFVQFRSLTSFEKKIRTVLHQKCNKISNEQLEIPRVDLYSKQARSASMHIYRLTEIYLTIFISVLSAVITCIYISTFNVWYSLFFVLAVIPSLIEIAFNSKLWQKYYEQEASLFREETAYNDAICGVDVVKENKINGANTILYDKWFASRKSRTEIENRKSRMMCFLKIILSVFKVIGDNGGLVISAVLLFNGKVNIGGFTAGIAAYIALKSGFAVIFDMFGNIRQFSKMVNPFFMYEDFPERDVDLQNEYKFKNSIKLNNVSFSYENGTRPAVDGVSLEIKKGETIAIVGENGAGKTTLLNLILGIYPANSGTVTYDDVDICGIAEQTLYGDKSVVKQKFNKYLGLNIRENILLGNDCDDVKLSTVKADLGLDEMADDLSLGREFGGSELSGGEWQKIACARGLYKSSDIIVLDEPTSAIDPLREKSLYDVFEKYSKQKTAIIVTHRLGAVRLADKIVVMQDGKISEYGTHEQLLKNNGKYKELWETQVQTYE